MARVVVVGGGLSGCGAALAARKAGAEVIILERTDMLAGVAIRAGVTSDNGWFVGLHELRFLGGTEIFDTLASIKLHDLHDNPVLPSGGKHRYSYHVALLEPSIRRVIQTAGVRVLFQTRVTGVVKENDRVTAVKAQDGSVVEGDSFVDCTGTRGGIANCSKYGKGCVLCIARCLTYGNPVGIVKLAGGKEAPRCRPDGTPGMPASSVTIFKESLAPELRARLEKDGVAIIPLAENLIDRSYLGQTASNLPEVYIQNIVLDDLGLVAKCVGIVHMDLDKLRQVPGFENVFVDNPRSSNWNAMAHFGIAEREATLNVTGVANLFCAGEKSGQATVAGAVITGYLAGHNAARIAFDREPLVLPRTLAIGDFMAFVTEKFSQGEIFRSGYVMSRGEYWLRMQKIGLFTDDVGSIKRRVDDSGLAGVLARHV
jgi:hypothetical protein